jgi:hypothetical protein
MTVLSYLIYSDDMNFNVPSLAFAVKNIVYLVVSIFSTLSIEMLEWTSLSSILSFAICVLSNVFKSFYCNCSLLNEIMSSFDKSENILYIPLFIILSVSTNGINKDGIGLSVYMIKAFWLNIKETFLIKETFGANIDIKIIYIKLIKA